MKQKLENDLREGYPEIFQNVKIEVGLGWFTILDELARRIRFRQKFKNELQQIKATQVKEKFGGLRFYFTGGDDYIQGLVDMAEAMSYKTCEDCGWPGKTRNGNWIRTLCDGCDRRRTMPLTVKEET